MVPRAANCWNMKYIRLSLPLLHPKIVQTMFLFPFKPRLKQSTFFEAPFFIWKQNFFKNIKTRNLRRVNGVWGIRMREFENVSIFISMIRIHTSFIISLIWKMKFFYHLWKEPKKKTDFSKIALKRFFLWF